MQVVHFAKPKNLEPNAFKKNQKFANMASLAYCV